MTLAVGNIVIPALKPMIYPALTFVEELSASFGFEQQECQQLRLALEEVMINVVVHGFADRPGVPFKLIIESAEDGLCLLVREKGIPFAPDKMPRYDPADMAGKNLGIGCFCPSKV